MKLFVTMCSKTRGIGYKQLSPFKFNDMKRFEKLTMGEDNNAIVMGKKKWLSLPKKPLPYSKNIVISNSLKNVNAIIYNDPMLILKDKQKYDNIWVIGGGQLYNFYLRQNLIKEIYLTEVFNHNNKNIEFDTFFPRIPKDFKCDLENETVWNEGVVYGPILFKYSYIYKKYVNINMKENIW